MSSYAFSDTQGQSYSTSQAKTFKLFYPRQPAICIKLSTASPFTTSPPAISIYQVTIRSLRQPLLHHFQQDPYQPYRPRHKPRCFMLTLLKLRTLTFQVLFCLLIGDFVPKRIYHLTFAFAFISCAVLLPLLVFIFYFCFTFYFCRLRIRGQPNQEYHPQEIPLRERLGPLPPVPEP